MHSIPWWFSITVHILTNCQQLNDFGQKSARAIYLRLLVQTTYNHPAWNKWI